MNFFLIDWPDGSIIQEQFKIQINFLFKLTGQMAAQYRSHLKLILIILNSNRMYSWQDHIGTI